MDALEEFEIYKSFKDKNINNNSIPVSYTHLDVYKRQPLSLDHTVCLKQRNVTVK